MTLHKVNIGTNEDGSPRYHFHSDDPTKPVVYTGPNINGNVTLPDGTVYDVSEHYIEVEPGHDGLLSHVLGMKFQDDGHPLHGPEEPFVHTCTDHCGELKVVAPTDPNVGGTN